MLFSNGLDLNLTLGLVGDITDFNIVVTKVLFLVLIGIIMKEGIGGQIEGKKQLGNNLLSTILIMEYQKTPIPFEFTVVFVVCIGLALGYLVKESIKLVVCLIILK